MTLNPPPSLEFLGTDILYQICLILAETAPVRVFKPLHEYERTVEKRSLAALASTSKLLRETAKPSLFSEIIIRDGYWGNGSWDVVTRKLEKLLRDDESGGILKFVRTFEFSLTLERDDRTPAPDLIFPLLAQTLQYIPMTKTLNILLPPNSGPDFAYALQSIRLPNVEKVFVGAYNEFVIALCPNVRVVWSERRFGDAVGRRRGVDPNLHALSLIHAVLAAGGVEELKITQDWTVGMVCLLTSQPNRLTLLSEVVPPHNSSTELPDLLGPLSRLPHLRTLELGTAAQLNLDYTPQLTRRVERPLGEEHWAQKKALLMVDDAFGENLTRLHIGNEEFHNSAIFERRSSEVGEIIRWNDERSIEGWIRVKTKLERGVVEPRHLVRRMRHRSNFNAR